MTLPPEFTLLQVTPALDAGGVERTTVDVGRAVARAGARSLVASAGGRLEAELAEGGSELVRLPLDTKNPARLILNTGRLERVIRTRNVSLVHARSRAPAISALLAARRTGAPFVTTYHGVYSARTPLKRWYNSVMARGVLTIANSEFTRARILAEHRVDPARVVVIPRGVDLARFDPSRVDPRRVAALRERFGLEPGERRLVALLAGRLTRWKGQGLLIEALARLGSRRAGSLVLVLAGDPQGRSAYQAELEALAGRLGVSEAVRIVGHVEDMPAAYLAADVALAPSLEPEAFGRTAVEPQAMGRPVLAADHGATAETVVEGVTGFRLPPGDVEAWASGLARLLDAGPEARAAMGERGRERVRRLYSLEAMTAATLEVYGRVLAARGAAA